MQALAAVADGQDGFAGRKGMLQDREIRFFTICVRVVSLFVARGAVERRANVRGAAGQDESIQVCDLRGKLACRELQ